MKRRCLSCMREFNIPPGSENESSVCPYCGFVENTRPKILYHLFPGTILYNKYIVGVVLGSGGFGVTYKAWDSMLGIVVAIKEYYPTSFVQRVPGTKDVIVYDGNKRQEYLNSLNRFLEEARNTAMFNNPNIVHVDGYFEENNTAYFVMEFLDGISLKEYLKANGNRVDIADLDYIFEPVMDALKAIHEKGIIHRDISPDNIFMCNQGSVKLIDFGAARFSNSEKEKTLSIILKPGYAPPEQYQSKSIQGPWTDIYALSATLYRVVTGKDPVESVNRFPEEFIKKKDLLVEPKVYLPEISDNLNNTILKGMSIEPALRFQTVDEFEEAYKGNKKVKNPNTERLHRLIWRAVGIASIVLIIAIGALFATDLYQNKKSKVELNPAWVTIWLPYDNMTEEDAIEYGERIVADFKEEYKQISIEITVIPEDEYQDKLEEAAEKGELPTLFVSDDASDEIMKKAITVNDIYDYIELEDVNYIGSHKNSIGDGKRMPTGYYLPVVFVRKTNDVDMKNLVVSKLDDVKTANGYYVSDDDALITAKTLNVAGDYLVKDRRETTDIIADFEEGNITYYLATTEEYDRIAEVAAGRFEMRPYSVGTVYGRFADYWSISSGSEEASQIAAKVIVAYMLMDSVQQQKMIMGYDNSFPLNKTAYDSFININGKYDIVEQYPKISFGLPIDDVEEESGDSVLLILFISMVVVAVASGVVIFRMVKKGKKHKGF